MEASVLRDIGYIHYQKKRFNKALVFFEKSRKRHEKIGDSRKLAVVHNFIALVYDSQNQYQQAIEQYKKAF